MGKKKNQVDKAAFHRMNFLVQASILMAPLPFNAHFGTQLKKVQQKSLKRLDPSIKRMYCKRCNSVLILKKTCEIRVTLESITYLCNACEGQKKLSMKNKELFNDIYGKDI